MTKCIICNNNFTKGAHNQLMCSPKCKRKYHTEKQKQYYKRNNKYQPRKRNCVICSVVFTLAPKSNAISCSKECSALRAKLRHKSYAESPEYIDMRKKAHEKHIKSGKRAEWIKKNRRRLTENHSIYTKERKKTDKAFHMITVMRAAIGRMYKGNRHVKTLKDIIDYSPAQLKAHLESQFKEGMSWENYGRLGWHIDHIVPLTAFQFFDEYGNVNEDQLKRCMSLDNLQPLWYADNIRKGGATRLKLIKGA